MTRPGLVGADPAGPTDVADAELDPRVKRFLRFMVEMAIASLVREQHEATDSETVKRDGRTSEGTLQLVGEEE